MRAKEKTIEYRRKDEKENRTKRQASKSLEQTTLKKKHSIEVSPSNNLLDESCERIP